ncbi:MAG: hypothetical protein HRU12_05330, partial [Phaeodactylibacter sp.]|nr:hypothetical protein [Phaeodactylibacter sp.]
LDFGGIDLSLEQQRYLQGPIIQHKSAFADLTPKWMFNLVAGERLGIVLDEHKQGLTSDWRVGPIELATALYPATHDAPMLHEYAQIYLWAGAQACARHYQKPREHFWEALGGQVVEDQEVMERGGRYFHSYQELCQTIRKRVIKTQAERERRIKPKSPTQDQEQLKAGGGTEQLSLF